MVALLVKRLGAGNFKLKGRFKLNLFHDLI
jgi:hypothetical protein